MRAVSFCAISTLRSFANKCRKDANTDARIIAWLEPNVVAAVEACHAAWCEIKADGYEGYVERKFLWGIYDSEDFD